MHNFNKLRMLLDDSYSVFFTIIISILAIIAIITTLIVFLNGSNEGSKCDTAIEEFISSLDNNSSLNIRLECGHDDYLWSQSILLNK